MRIGVNSKEALAGQAFANLATTVDAGSYDADVGQLLSPLGTVIALDKGPQSDEFFLTFEVFSGESNTFTDIEPSVPADPADPANPPDSDIGLRTFEEINSAIAQLALTSCSELVENRGSAARDAVFPGFDFTAGALSAFNTPAKRAQVIDPLLKLVMNVDQSIPANNLATQPDATEIGDLLGSDSPQVLDAGIAGTAYDSLIEQMLVGSADDTTRTAQIVKAVCAAATGAAVMLVQ